MLYERLKKDIWLQIATEMWMVWTEAERMHWHLGKAQLKKRGTDDSFRTTPVNVDNLPLPQVDDSQVQAPIQQQDQQQQQQQQVASRMGLPWSGDEEGILFACRDAKMSWNQISDRLPGRNPRSCQRQHSLLARGPAWSQERKNKLCKLYESLKPTMWAKIGDQLHIPWQTVEDMHWCLEPRNITSSSVPRPEGTVPSGAHGARGRRDGLELGSSVTVPGILEFDEGVKLLHQQAQRETYGRR
ncbi:related to DRPLA protein [Claviceps purpurea 20.1]|uniref:Related to DRPLA protein n=1 Tax=Claviceps purpurea (strain 20.1) TaxID=1111077 RepID=M1VW36_CLAP2|nr:related to DRPLA protein [Claviceps purpurea 20.1]